MSYSPYTPMESQPQFGGVSSNPPQVIFWYKVYCGFMTLLYLLCSLVSIALIVFHQQLGEREGEAVIMLIQGIVLLVVSGFLTILFGIGPFLPRKKGSWYFGFAPIGIGLTSPCLMPASIPLLIFWLKPETKKYFGM